MFRKESDTFISNNRMMNKLWALLSGLFILYSCNSSVTWMDEQIDPGTKSNIDKLDKQVIESLSAGDYSKAEGVFSDKLKEIDKGGHFDSLFSQAKERVSFSKFKIRNQFYIRNSVKEKDISFRSGLSGDHDYSLDFKSINKETFATVGYFEDSLQILSLVTIYGKYGDTWRLNMFHLGIIRLMNKDAFDWYERAAGYFKKGCFVDAANDLDLCQQVIEPGNKVWHYQKQKDFDKLSRQVWEATNKAYSFPLTVSQVPSKPKIFKEFPQVTKQGYFPMILYTTSLKMSDTALLRKECDAMHQVIGKVFHGLDLNNEYIIYRIFEKIPSNNDLGVNYEFVRKTH